MNLPYLASPPEKAFGSLVTNWICTPASRLHSSISDCSCAIFYDSMAVSLYCRTLWRTWMASCSVIFIYLFSAHGQTALRAGTQGSNYPPAAPRLSLAAVGICILRMSSVNHNGCAADGDHDHAVGLSHRLIAEANAHDGIDA